MFLSFYFLALQLLFVSCKIFYVACTKNTFTANWSGPDSDARMKKWRKYIYMEIHGSNKKQHVAQIPHGHKQVCVCHLSVLLAVVCGRAVLWRGRAVAVGLCRLIVLVPLLHGLLRHTHITKHEQCFLVFAWLFWFFFLCHLSILWVSLSIVPALQRFVPLSLSFQTN